MNRNKFEILIGRGLSIYATFLLSVLMIISVNSASALIKADIDSKKKLKVSLSAKDNNRISIENGKIDKVYGAGSNLYLESDESTGQLFLKPRETLQDPVTITVITDKLETQDIEITFSDITSESLVLSPSVSNSAEKILDGSSDVHIRDLKLIPNDNILSNIHRGLYSDTNLYNAKHEQAIKMIKQILVGDVSSFKVMTAGLDSYHKRKIALYKLYGNKNFRVLDDKKSIIQDVPLELQYVLENLKSVALIYKLKNSSKDMMMLNEELIKQIDDIAICIISPELAKGETTKIVIIKDKRL